MDELPVNAVLAQICAALQSSTRLILQAPPGAGKTTRVPLALLDHPDLQGKKIIMLEPRRLAARNAAARMAFLLGEKVGERVGYQIRADRCSSQKTRILVLTEGILTRMLQDDPSLEEVALVIFDEFHERNLQAELSLAFCLQSQELLRAELKIMLMSATLNSSALSRLLDGAAIIRSEGRSYPVENIYLPPGQGAAYSKNLIALSGQLIIQQLFLHSGNFLVFLPGVGEIKQLQAFLSEKFAQQGITHILIAPLFGELSQKQQDDAIQATSAGQRKLVLATNIAETSLTIDGISVVIDSGLQRISKFNPRLAMNSLQTVAISQDSAQQRSGRAGRLGPGVCYRLWTQSKHQQLHKHSSPEILHSDLTPLLLELAKWGVSEVSELSWLDQPNPGAIAQAKDLLLELQALDSAGRITEQGEIMLQLGVHPRLAHMLTCAVSLQLGDVACILAALLTEKDIFTRQQHPHEPFNLNLMDRLHILFRLADATNKLPILGDFNRKQAKWILKTADLLFRRLKKAYPKLAGLDWHQQTARTEEYLGVLIAFAYPDRIAKCRSMGAKNRTNKDQGRYLLSSGKGAYIDQRSEYWYGEYIVIADLDANLQTNEAKIYRLAEISREQLQQHFSHLWTEEVRVAWNSRLQRVEGTKLTKIGQITLEKKSYLPETRESLEKELLKGIRETGLGCLNWSKTALNLKQRVECLNYQKAHMLVPILSNSHFPDFSDEALLSNLEHWFAPYLNGETSIKQLQSLDLHALLISQIDWSLQQQLDEWFPSHLLVPSGSKIAIDYTNKEKPTLAVKLQELFGLQQTPAIVKGQLKLLLHLLSPAMRPMQVTEDLNNFWHSTYPQVKKELQGKYKKHYWPDDPITAKATSKIKRFMENK